MNFVFGLPRIFFDQSGSGSFFDSAQLESNELLAAKNARQFAITAKREFVSP
jgi:hypothetical protein